MQRRLPFLALLALSTTALAQTPAPATDPNAYLEDIHGTRALDTVKRWNTQSLAALEAKPGYARYRQRALDLLQADRQIATPDQILGDQVLNLWQDKTNVRGLWRVASLASFTSGKPVWRTLIDVDALGKTEGKSWVWKGATCRSPSYDRCMVALSNGGGDAVEEREFDIPTGKFVTDGFVVPSFKTGLNWAGPDALYVATDFGAGSLTKSGYPRTVKRWQRGTPLSAAATMTSATPDDVGIETSVFTDGDRRYPLVSRNVDFFHSKRSHIAENGRLVPSPLPDDAEINAVLDGRLIATLASDWKGIPSGSVVAYSVPDVLAGRAPTIERVLVPTATQAVEQVDLEQVGAVGEDARRRLWPARVADAGRGRRLDARRIGVADRIDDPPRGDRGQGRRRVRGGRELPQPARALCRPPKCQAGHGRHAASAVRCLRNAGRTAVRDLEGWYEDPLFPRAQEGHDGPDACARPRLWRVPQCADADLSRRPALSLGPGRAVLGRGGQRVRARQHPWRWRIRAALAPDAAARKPAKGI
ncbi:hypothetical protein QP150_17935 [Sphingomonas sp. 22L2VL55-3]